MNDLQDTDTPLEAAGECGRIFTFLGQTLKPYSQGYKLAYFRLGFDGPVSEREDAQHLVFLLTQEPMAADRVRGAGVAAFRLQSDAWFDATVKTPDALAELLRVAKDIRADADQADGVEVKPEPPKPGAPPPPPKD